jgi:hypothetical protein
VAHLAVAVIEALGGSKLGRIRIPSLMLRHLPHIRCPGTFADTAAARAGIERAAVVAVSTSGWWPTHCRRWLVAAELTTTPQLACDEL